MSRALALAARAGGRTAPNPMVGAVALDASGRAVAAGFHRSPGGPHAERVLLGDARRRGVELRGTTLVCTLEPCVHQGRTPPCAPAVAAAGFARVVVAARDPNPLVDGRGLALLRSAGVEVVEGVAAREALRLNEAFFGWVASGRPFVHLKVAMLADGTIYRGGGKPREITGPEARRLVHWWRHLSPAVAVGAGTLRADDPALTVRELPEGKVAEPWEPRRVVLTSAFGVPPGARALRPSAEGVRALVVGVEGEGPRSRAALERAGVETVGVSAAPAGGLDLRAALAALGSGGVTGLLVEAGPTLAGALLGGGLADRLSVFTAGEDGPGAGAGRAARERASSSGGGALRWEPPGGLPFGGLGLEDREEARLGPDRLVTGRLPRA